MVGFSDYSFLIGVQSLPESRAHARLCARLEYIYPMDFGSWIYVFFLASEDTVSGYTTD